MTQKRIVALAIGLGILDLVLMLPGLRRGEWLLLNYNVVTWSFAIAGAIAWIRRPEHPMGRLLLLIAFLWALLNLVMYRTVPLAWTLANLGRNLWLIALAYLILVFPGSRLATLKNRILFSLAVVLGVVPQSLYLIFEDGPGWQQKTPTEKAANLVHVDGFDHISDAGQVAGDVGALTLLVVVALEIRRRWRRTTKPARRAFTPVVVGGFATIALAVGLNILTEQIPFLEAHRKVIVRSTAAGLAVVPFGLLVGLLRAQSRRARIGDLVVELRELPVPQRLQDLLRKNLEDPSLAVGVWLPEDNRYAAPDGDVLELPDDGGDQVATFLDRHGEPLAAIVHDRALLDDPRLVESVKAAAQLAVENDRLQEEVLAQLAEVHASRARIVEAADRERRRIERNLHDGAQQRLVSVSLALRLLGSNLPEDDAEVRQALSSIADQLQEALGELRDLARGIHPAILTEAGLGAALESLADRAPVTVELTHNVEDRLAEPVEVAGYYVVAEALANVAKHSGASVATVTVTRSADRLRIEVADDGLGTVAVEPGTGLRGLADRVDALGGVFDVIGSPGHGTTVTADIPLAPAATEEVERSAQATPVLVRERIDHRDAGGERPILSCRGIHHSYGADRALDDVDIDVYPDEVVALLGTNGAGKSTLLRVIAGLTEPGDGTIHFCGEDITYLPAERRALLGVAYIPGGKGVFAPLSVIDNLMLFGNGTPRREIAARTERVFGVFPQLADRRHETAGKLSRGQQQMVALAKALMTDAKLVVVDELCLGLAPDLTEHLLELITSVNAEGLPVLFVEQSIEPALRIARRAYFLDGAKVQFEGSPAELAQRRDLLRSVFLADAARRELAHA